MGSGEGTESNPNVIYDGPAAGAPTVAPQPEPEVVPAPPSAQAVPRTTNQFASYRSERSTHFERGLRWYREGNLSEATAEFQAAAQAEPENALYHYHHALALFDQHGAEVADEALQTAISAEKRQAIASWGQRMERIQGPARIWIEKARRNAGLVK